MRRLIALGALLLATGAAAAQQAPPPSAPLKVTLSDAEKEGFLLEAEIVRRRSAPGGITNSGRATLRRQGLVHDAHIQTIDEYQQQYQLAAGIGTGLRRLDRPTLEVAMKDLLERPQIEGLLARRDRIVQHYDAKIAQLGETAVLYDLPTRVIQAAAAR